MATPSLLYLNIANSSRHSTTVVPITAMRSTLSTSAPTFQIWSL